MKIGFASAVSLQLLRPLVANGAAMPPGNQFGPAADWIQELLRKGHEVTVYATAAEITEPQTFYGDRLTIRIAPLRSWGTGKDFFKPERQHLQKLMALDQCEVIHAHWTYEFALAALASGVPTLITIHDLPWNVLRYFRDPHRAARLVMAYMVALKGKHFTAVSEDAARHFRHYLNPTLHVDVVPNGLPNWVFDLHSTFPAADDGRTFATVLQGWTERKNARAALRGFHLVHKADPSVRLLMFGVDYQPEGPAHRWAREQGMDTGVEFVGVLPYPELLKRISLEVTSLVHPSLDESFSMASVEAMALHKSVIAGRSTPGVREVLAFGDAGMLVNVRDPEAIAAGMQRLLTDTAYRQDLEAKGFARARALYRLEVVMAQYEALYRDLGSGGATT